MKLFNAIAAAAVIGTSFIAANPATSEPTAAVPAQANLAFKEAVIRNHPLTALAETHGAKVHIKEECKGDYIALFRPIGAGHLYVCGSKSTTATELEVALTHEAVHLAQHCWASKEGSIHRIDAMKKQAIENGYSADASYAHESAKASTSNAHDYNMEWEAYYFEDAPKAVADMIKDACTVNHSDV